MTINATLDFLARLVEHDTTSHKTNLPLVGWVEDYLKGLGAKTTRIPDPDGTKANLFATFGPSRVPGYILSGHTDVVPVEGQDWTKDPFKLTIENGRAYGRGTTDMKGYVACCLAAAPAIAKANLKRPVHFAFSYDEEVGCTGVRGMLDWLRDAPAKPIAAFIGEPTSMQVVIGHKGGQRVNVTVRGKTAHSSLAPHAVNSVEWGARLITYIRDKAEALERDGPFDPLYDVPHTTMHCGIFHGGIAANIVPHEAQITFECRALGHESADAYIDDVLRYAREELEPRMKRLDPDSGFTFSQRPGLPGLDTDPQAEVVTLAKRLTGRNDHAKVAYGTEASLFVSMADIPSVVAGPGDIAQAHQPDEYIEISELEKCGKFISRLVDHCET